MADYVLFTFCQGRIPRRIAELAHAREGHHSPQRFPAYYVIRQPLGGVTLAARLLSRDLAELERDVQRIARSIQITGQQ